MKRAARTAALPPPMKLLPFHFPDWRVKGASAEAVRIRLLDEHGLGTIALGESDLRIAFSCLLEEQIPDVFVRIAQAIRATRV